MAQVQLELAEEAVEDARHGTLSFSDVSPHMFLQIGLDLEEQQ